jgi:hypothetical protein
VRRRWQAEYCGGGRFVLRPRPRTGRLAAVGFAAVVGAGAAHRLGERADATLSAAAHAATVRHLAGAVLFGGLLLWLWLRSGRG